MKAKWKIRMGASKINDITRVFRSCNFWKKQVIFVLNFTRIHCHYLLITKREKLLNFWLKCHSLSLWYSFKFARKFLLFAFFQYYMLFFVISFSLFSFNSSIPSSSTLYLETRHHRQDNFFTNKFDITINCCLATWVSIVSE